MCSAKIFRTCSEREMVCVVGGGHWSLWTANWSGLGRASRVMYYIKELDKFQVSEPVGQVEGVSFHFSPLHWTEETFNFVRWMFYLACWERLANRASRWMDLSSFWLGVRCAKQCEARELSERSAGPASNRFDCRRRQPMVFQLGWLLKKKKKFKKRRGGGTIARIINTPRLCVCRPAAGCIMVLGLSGHPISLPHCLVSNCYATFCHAGPEPPSLTSSVKSPRVILNVLLWSALWFFFFFNGSFATQES